MGCLFQKLGDDFVSIMDGDSEGMFQSCSPFSLE